MCLNHAQQKEFIPDDDFMDTSEIDSHVADDLYTTLLLYNESNLTVLEAVAQHFEWFTDH